MPDNPDTIVCYYTGSAVYCVHCIDADADLLTEDVTPLTAAEIVNDPEFTRCESCGEAFLDCPIF